MDKILLVDGHSMIGQLNKNLIINKDNSITVKNRPGSTLPSTGGIGTKLFYFFGSLLFGGSAVLLVTRKRMSAKED